VVWSENRKYQGQKCGISRQPYVGGNDVSVIADAVNTVLEPVLGDIRVDLRIINDGGKSDNKEEPQRHGCQRRGQKEPGIFAHKLAHAANIPRFAGGTPCLIGLLVFDPPPSASYDVDGSSINAPTSFL